MSPSEELINSLCLSSGFLQAGLTIGLVVGVFFLGLMFGYVAGKRKAILAALKRASERTKLVSIAGASQTENDDEAEEEEPKTKEDAVNELLDEFMDRSNLPGLDDHPGVYVNPIMMLHIRRKKEELRKEMMFEKLLLAQNFEDGYLDKLSPQERRKLDEELLDAEGGVISGGVGSVDGYTRKWGAALNSAKILAMSGASFAPGNKALDDLLGAEEKAAIEIRDKLKQIEGHLSKHEEIDVGRLDMGKIQKRKSDGKRLKDALTVANETKNQPFTLTKDYLSFDERRDFAQRGRARVAPPQDHEVKGSKAVRGVGRRSSVGNINAMNEALAEAKAAEAKMSTDGKPDADLAA